MLHTMSNGQALRTRLSSSSNSSAIDLIMARRGPLPRGRRHQPDDGSIHRFGAQMTILAHWRLWACLLLLYLRAHTCTGDGNAMVLRRDYRCRIWNSCNSTPPAFTAPAA